MTVAELIKVLQSHDQSLTVYADGYEGGLLEVSPGSVHSCFIVRDYNKDDAYQGPHEYASYVDEYHSTKDSSQRVFGLVISR